MIHVPYRWNSAMPDFAHRVFPIDHCSHHLSNSSVVPIVVASACCCLEIEMISQCTFFVSSLELQLTVSFRSSNLPDSPPGFPPLQAPPTILNLTKRKK